MQHWQNPHAEHAGRMEFDRARRRAAVQEVLARLAGRSADLLSYEDVRRRLHATQTSSSSIHEIPVAHIVGSVGRYTDFAQGFLPRRMVNKQRWARVRAMFESQTGLPPIDVYQIGEAYFVLDGNHRVSIARQMGLEHITAHVVLVKTRVSLSPDVSPDELILKAEQAEFLEATQIDRLYPQVEWRVTVPGRYTLIHQQIEALRFNREFSLGHEISDAEAVQHWYRSLYFPVIEVIRQQQLLSAFPGRTETDLYLWLMKHRFILSQSLNWQVSPESAGRHLARQQSGRLARLVGWLKARLWPGPARRPEPGVWRQQRLTSGQGHLFGDILVVLDGSKAGWTALEQATLIANLEAAQVLGLYLPDSGPEQDSQAAVQDVQRRFATSCQGMEVTHSFASEHGDPAEIIARRAEFAHLVILPAGLGSPTAQAGDESGAAAELSPALHSLLMQCCTPIVTTRRKASEMRRGLLVYRGDQPQDEEALYLAAYLGGLWELEIDILVLAADPAQQAQLQDACRQFLAGYGLQASFAARPPGDEQGAILAAVRASQADLLLLPAPKDSPAALAGLLARYPGSALISR